MVHLLFMTELRCIEPTRSLAACLWTNQCDNCSALPLHCGPDFDAARHAIEGFAAMSASGLSYYASTDQYDVSAVSHLLADGTVHRANFKLLKCPNAQQVLPCARWLHQRASGICGSPGPVPSGGGCFF